MTSDCKIPLSVLSDWMDDEKNHSQSPAHERISNHINHCPTCTQRLQALERLETTTAKFAEEEIEQQTQDTGWLDKLLENITLETKAGRSIPIPSENEKDILRQTEGSVLSAVRAAADSLDDILIGRCVLDGELTVAGEPIDVKVTALVRFGAIINEAAQQLRQLIIKELERVTELNIRSVNVTIKDIFDPASTEAEMENIVPDEYQKGA